MSVTVTKRTTAKGETRWVVRYRRGGRAYPVEHAGSFGDERDAHARRFAIMSELAAGRDPALLVRPKVVVEPRRTRTTIGEVAEAYRASRVDLAAETMAGLESHFKAIAPLGDRDPAEISVAEVQAWIGGLKLKPATVRRYVQTLRALLDFAGVEPNPARDRRVRLPREDRTTVTPPSAAEVDAIIAASPAKWRLPFRVLEQTGLRVGELAALAWEDVDEQALRFRVKAGKTAAARRWVAVPEWVMEEVVALLQREDRIPPERRVFDGLECRARVTGDAARSVMARACRTAGIARYSPHDLRHRYASIQVGRGVPVTAVAAQLGHSRSSMTLDVYSHVLIDEGGTVV